MRSPHLLFHTVKYLKARQIIGRIWFKLYRPQPVVITNARQRKPVRALSGHLFGTRSLFSNTESTTDTPLLRFLGDELTITSRHDWNRADKAKLFLYNVHYFDDLNAFGAPERVSLHTNLINRWIDENPAPLGNGWEPYPLSLRIVNWVKHFSRQSEVPDHWLDSLASQVNYLSRRLEYHLLGNHLFTNAKALVFAGCYLEDQDKLLGKGLGILKQQLPEQVLADGGHFELSPMYHCIAMADLLDLIDLAQCHPLKIPGETLTQWKQTLESMFSWLDRMRHPDGNISLFNDAAFGIAPDHPTLAIYAKVLGITAPETPPGSYHAADTGYFTIHRELMSCMLDIGRIGPDYIPGHAHADSLSFELSIFGQRLICNSGTSVYGTGDERLRQRGTPAHNTVVVDGHNSSEVWSGFRVARRAFPVDVSVLAAAPDMSDNTTVQVQAAHNGYRRLPGKNTHHRQWTVSNSEMSITDTITGQYKDACAHFHLHPAVTADIIDTNTILLTLASGQSVKFRTVDGHPELASSTWHPEFGKSVPNQKIVVYFGDSELHTQISWGGADCNG